LNPQHLVCRTSALPVELLRREMAGVGIEPTFRVFQTRANPSQLSGRGISLESGVASLESKPDFNHESPDLTSGTSDPTSKPKDSALPDSRLQTPDFGWTPDSRLVMLFAPYR
jgi:hypothetical protein